MSEEDIWYTAEEKRPPKGPVWGLFKGKYVEIVELALTDEEYKDYFVYSSSSWYSLESEKCGSVTHWKALIRPKKP